MAKYRYITSCVSAKGEDIIKMTNVSGAIEFDTFYRIVDREDFTELQKKLGYAVGAEKGLHIRNDWHVAYYSSWYLGRKCVYLTHSAIDYIFVEKEKYLLDEGNAFKVMSWLDAGRGVKEWPCLYLSGNMNNVLTPGDVTMDHWKFSKTPCNEYKRADEFGVEISKEFKRFRVGLRRGGNGMDVKLTDGASRNLKKWMDKAGEGSSYVFDYTTQEAVVLSRVKVVSLPDYIKEHAEEYKKFAEDNREKKS